MPSSQQARARVGRWLLALNVLASALAIGALHTSVLAACCVVAALSTFLVWWGAEPLRARPAATLVLAVGVGLLAWTALQAVPLPRGLVAAIAPGNADVWARALTPFREDGPAWVTLSLDPVATRVQVLRGVTYLLTFVAALRVAHRPAGIAFLERAIIVAGVTMAAAALLHPVFGAQRVFGAYQPGETYAFDPRHIAPLLNANHLAGYVNIGAVVALAAAVRPTETMPRVVAGAAALLLVGANLWASSRGGTGALALGVVVTIGLAVGARRSERSKLVGAGVFAAVIVAGIVLFVLSASDESRSELAQTDLSKLRMFQDAMRLVPSHPVAGVGRGAFESTFPAVRQGTGFFVHTHPENLPAQWITEWGVPVAVAAFVALAWGLRPATALARSQPPVGAWAALAVAAVHNLVDFNSEVPGVAIALSVCAAIVTGGTGGARSTPGERRRDAWARRPSVLAVASFPAAVVAVTLTVPFVADELYTEQRALKDLAIDRNLTREAFHRELREAMLHHPAEPYFPFLGAVRASVTREESVLPWAARALERSPVYGRAHLLIARALFARSPAQARLEYRLAAEQDEGLAGIGGKEGAPLVRGLDDALELAPAGDQGVGVLEALAVAIAPRLPATAALVDREVARRRPSSLAYERRVGAAALADLTNKEPWCDPPAACLSEGLAAAERIQKATPSKCEGFALAGELRVAAGEVDEGLSQIDRAIELVDDRSACVRRFIRAARAAGRRQQTDAAVDRLVRMGCSTATDCADNLEFAAQIELELGNRRRALAQYKRAWERAPEREHLLVQVASLASSEGLHGEALEAYTKLAARSPNEARWTEAVAKERAALQAGLRTLPKP